MITVTVEFDIGESVYHVDRANRTITGGLPDGDLVVVLVDEMLASGGPVGPQVDEFLGATGDWTTDMNVVAAFMDAADVCGGRVQTWDFDTATV